MKLIVTLPLALISVKRLEPEDKRFALMEAELSKWIKMTQD